MALQRWISLRGGPHCVFALRTLGPVNVGLMAAGTLTLDLRVGQVVELVPAKPPAAAIHATVARISVFDGDSWQGTSAVAVAATYGRPVLIEVG